MALGETELSLDLTQTGRDEEARRTVPRLVGIGVARPQAVGADADPDRSASFT